MDDKRYYWLKLRRDFFKRHDMMIIESMPNGKDYELFYLKLLLESVDHNGNLRFSNEIPYDEKMLSVITNTNIDIVRSAIKIFTNLNMMEILDDGTFFMNEVEKMIGSAVDNDNANRQRRFRERKKQELLQERYGSVTNNNESIDIDIEKDIDIKENSINTIKEKTEPMALSIDVDVCEGENIFLKHWNSLNIIKHKKITDKSIKKIKELIKNHYTEEDIMLAMDRYNQVLKDKTYFFSYKWSLEDFLCRQGGITSFMENGEKWLNYLDSSSGKKAVEKDIINNIDMSDWWGGNNA